MDKEAVHSPDHYNRGKTEVIDMFEDQMTTDEFRGFCVGNVMKYILRFSDKNGIEDLKKAQWYLDRLRKGVEAL